MLKKYRYDLNYEMVKTIGEEFGPQKWVKRLVDSNESPGDFFARYGEELMARCLELGDKNTDRSYEVLKEAIRKMGSMKFPLLPQRFVEIAYLSTQPFKRLRIYANTPKIFSYGLGECSIYQELKGKFSDDVLRTLPCKNVCISLLKKVFSSFDLDVIITMDSTLAEGSECRFTVKKS